jgi:SAM-dependent methyltransferase
VQLHGDVIVGGQQNGRPLRLSPPTRDLDHDELSSLFRWDTHNWSKALEVWEPTLASLRGRHVLALGELDGNMSALCALHGARVVCTDVEPVSETVVAKHERLGVADLVEYRLADATALPYREASFDAVIFKSMLGALESRARQLAALHEIHRVLVPGGSLLFAENLSASRFHALARRIGAERYGRWHYPRLDELEAVLAAEGLDVREARTFGLLGLAPLPQRLRSALYGFDDLAERRFPARWRYVYAAACSRGGRTGVPTARPVKELQGNGSLAL